MKKTTILALAMSLGLAANAATINYTPDNTSIFRNPERGFTEEYGGETMLSTSKNRLLKNESLSLTGERASQSLVVLVYYLGNYKTQELPDEILQGFDADMQTLRDKGFKCILRFGYDWKNGKDASLEYVLKHITKLKPFIKKNSDVIYVLETGFVGQWGEWYYSTHFGNESMSITDNPDRAVVVDSMLAACPADRFLLVRYPMIKTEYFSLRNISKSVLTSSEAFTGTARARIGYHNDAFLNAWGDCGTYASTSKEDDPKVRQFIAEETLYVPNGGETNVEDDEENPNLSFEVFNKAEAQMAQYHWSFCGSTYAEQVTNKWRDSASTTAPNSTIFEELDRKMGYRYQLNTATLPATAVAGAQAHFQFSITNTGYAPLYNFRRAQVVLKSSNGTIYPIDLASDPRTWKPNGAVTNIDEYLTIPADVPAGTYQLYLAMPDTSSKLKNDPRFAIRFANQNIWESSTGLNKLNASITITQGTVTPPDPPTPHTGIELPATLNKSNMYQNSDTTWWSEDSSYYDFGSTDAANTDRSIDWQVYLRYPGNYIISDVATGPDSGSGHSWNVQLLSGSNVVAECFTDSTWDQGAHTYANTLNLSAVPQGEYVLRVKNSFAWAQPKLQSLTLSFDGELPTGIENNTLRQNGQAYDILGRPVDNNYHGIVIQNGKKYLR